MSLTEAGEYVFAYTATMLQQLDQHLQQLQTMSKQPIGHIRLSAPPTWSKEVLAPLIAKFLSQYPQMSCSVDCTSVPTNLLSQQVDVAFRHAVLHDEPWVAWPLPSISYQCIASTHLSRSITKPHDLTQVPTFAYAQQQQAVTWCF